MPLSPEDVVEKRFNPTRVREGYAQDEVDDFLDEVVTELRRLNAENDELRSQLQRCRARVAELSGTEVAETAEGQAAPVAVDAAAAVPAPAPVPAAASPGAEGGPAAQAAGVIALAQRLHDEYVREGQQQRDALLTAARERAERTVSEAEVQRDRTLEELQGRRRQLEEAIAQLHGRESTYREHLESFIAGQLEELRRAGRVVPDDAVTR
ncbi:DivIVA domain-containing protein [Kineococcus indalonis]|uniref:DivIVA domain-containing protein n=1 Tax=Kineococcus indalonis TaxID=2696566 RepID=UPI001411E285|nr:DivIVA domain-containing protein [Kineococcus indalonis]NAZ86411.1 DivIVA domain-containing protein [Kineococcus indalonis]